MIAWKDRERTGAQAVAEQLRACGLLGTEDNVLIGNPGSGEEWLYLEMTGSVLIGLAEAAVGSIVDGASRVGGNKAAVAIAHGFVGLSGLQGAIFNAAQRQSPLFVIVGTADTDAHTGETHMFADVEGAAVAARAKFVKVASDPRTLLRDLRDAIGAALTPPFGPVVFIIGADVAAAPNAELVKIVRPPDFQLAPPESEIVHLAAGLLAAKRPCLLVGDGVSRSGAHEHLLAVAELLGADVWASMEAEVNFPRNHPLYRGNLGHMHDSRGREFLVDRDYALAVGTPLYQTVFHSRAPLFAEGTPVAAVNYDYASMLRGHNDVALPILGDPKRVLQLLFNRLKQQITSERTRLAEECIKARWKEKSELLKQRRAEQLSIPGVTIAKFAQMLEEHMQRDGARPIIFNEALLGGTGLTDWIKNVDMPGAYYDTSGGSLGEWAGAVGAAMVRGKTIAVIGDGGFHYAPQALWNAAQAREGRLPIGFLVANNRSYGLLVDNMRSALERRGFDPTSIPPTHYYSLPSIDYAKIAEGYGVAAERVTHEDEIAGAVKRLLDLSQPYLVDLVLQEGEA